MSSNTETTASLDELRSLNRTELLERFYADELDADTLSRLILELDNSRGEWLRDWLLTMIASIAPGARPNRRY